MQLRPNRWNDIRLFYRWALPFIMAERADEWGIDPYAWAEDNIINLTPIETWLWADIRNHNAILYPQFPVGRFFVDFANPKARVAIECDGAAYHTDKARDDARDAWLRANGWHVHRITGRDCRTDFDEETRNRGAADLFIEDICERHSIRRNCTQRPNDGELVSAAVYMEEVKAEFARGSWKDLR